MTDSSLPSTRTHKKRPSPVSVRLSADERALLVQRAGSLPLSTYIKRVLFAENAPSYRAAPKRVSLDHAVFARALGYLGQSSLASNLAALAKAAETGNLYFEDGTRRQLEQACEDVRAMRTLLLQALGKKTETPNATSRAFESVSGDRP